MARKKYVNGIQEEVLKRGNQDSSKEPPKSKKPEKQSNDSNQFWSIVLFASGILVLLMAVIKGSAGWNAIHNFLLGLFGAASLLVPAILIYTAVLIGLEKSQKCVSGRAVWGIALMFLVSAAIQIFFVGFPEGDGLIEALYNDGKVLKGGGVASIIIAGPLMKFFGIIGARIITVIMFFVFFMLLTGMGLIQFFEFITRPFRWIYKGIVNAAGLITGNYDDYEDDDDEQSEAAQAKPAKKNSKLEDTLIGIGSEDFTAEEEKPAPKKRTKAKVEIADTKEETNDIDLDIPLPVEKKQMPKTETESESEKDDDFDFLFGGEASKADESLDLLISNAAETSAKNAAKQAEAAAEEENSVLEEEKQPEYILPPIDILKLPDNKGNSSEATAEMREKADTIINTFDSFGVKARITNIFRGPSITRYEIQPGAGVKVSKIKGLEDDIALSLAAQGVRIEAPVPGKAAVGIEVPNIKKDLVSLRELLSSAEFRASESKLTFAVGRDIAGNVILGDVAKMPHVIIAGTTGSGKSVCTRSIIMSILYNAAPDEVKLILIDPKIVEFKIFDGIPHLLIPIVTDSKKAAGALNWAVNEMMRRYQIFADEGANDIKSYNALAADNEEIVKIPQIVIFIDELADMMLVAGKEVEDSICRLAQMGRAAGMHLVVATQRPTTDVITGLIKANIPSRIALSVMSQVDSRTIIDMAGADKLLGNGDMLYMPIGMNKPLRVQGCFASTKEIDETVKFIKGQSAGDYDSDIIEAVESLIPVGKNDDSSADISYEGGKDTDYVERAIELGVRNGQLSTSMLQRKLKLGFARAARIMDELEEMGVIGPSEGAKPRKVLMSQMQYDARRANMQD
ncbi:MAG: DNA translocase FtsK 4TM domain-containing protein [Ruminococcus sp.]|nr:DNA translocase FtsK [Oscillospiraceae bacterium]